MQPSEGPNQIRRSDRISGALVNAIAGLLRQRMKYLVSWPSPFKSGNRLSDTPMNCGCTVEGLSLRQTWATAGPAAQSFLCEFPWLPRPWLLLRGSLADADPALHHIRLHHGTRFQRASGTRTLKALGSAQTLEIEAVRIVPAQRFAA